MHSTCGGGGGAGMRRTWCTREGAYRREWTRIVIARARQNILQVAARVVLERQAGHDAGQSVEPQVQDRQLLQPRQRLWDRALEPVPVQVQLRQLLQPPQRLWDRALHVVEAHVPAPTPRPTHATTSRSAACHTQGQPHPHHTSTRYKSAAHGSPLTITQQQQCVHNRTHSSRMGCPPALHVTPRGWPLAT